MDLMALCKALLKQCWVNQSLRVMKIIAIIMLTACMQVCAKGFGQTITLSLKNVPLAEVFKEIKKQAGYDFIYAVEDLQQSSNIDINVNHSGIIEVLRICLKDQPLTYSIVDKFIIIKNKGELKTYTIALSPTINIRGKIVTVKGEAIPLASVSIKGSKIATATDENGEFVLNGVDAAATLIFSCVGYESQELKLKGETSITVTLNLKVSQLSNIAVTYSTGYQNVPKERATGSFDFISKEQLEQRASADIISKLEGTVSGLVFNKSANDGSNQIRIRGESTIFGNPSPLIVVDGFPYDGDINNINPNDVENITILKDAAAASIWGVRAGNGVIVIVTKRGKINQPLKLEVNANISLGETPNLHYAPQISPSDYVDVEKFLFSNGFYDGTLTDPGAAVVSPIVEILNKERNGIISSADASTQIEGLRKHDLRNDQLKYLYRKEARQQYALNLSGGSTKSSYYFSIGYDKDNANLVGNSSDRISLLSQSTFMPIDRLEIKASIAYTESNSITNGLSNIPNAYPYTQLVNGQGIQLSVPQHRAEFEDTVSNHNFLDWKYYPLQEINNQDNENKSFDTRLLASIKYAILKGLSLNVGYEYARANTQGKLLQKAESYYIRNNINSFAILDANGNYVGSNFPSGGILTINNSNLVSNSGRMSLNYSRDWGIHALAIIAGFEVREIQTDANSSALMGYNDVNGSFVVPDYYQYFPTYPSGNYQSLGGASGPGFLYSGTINRFRSYYANAAYTFKNRYTFSASGRLDGSNYFGVETNKKTVPLWSGGLKWDISKESFYKIKQLPIFDLRVTYGYNGNLDQTTAAITTFQYSRNDPYTGFPYAIINNVPNRNLRWEKIGQLNIGIDFSVVRNRISGAVEYFQKRGTDLIGDEPVDPTTGVSQVRGNFSGLLTKGMDLQITSKNTTSIVQWTTTFLFSYASDKVTRYDIPIAANSYLQGHTEVVPLVGKSLYSFYSYKWAGLDPSTGGPQIYLGDTLTKDFSSLNQGQVTLKDLAYSGRYNPSITGSLYNSISWKNISLAFNIVYKMGYYFRRTSISYSNLYNNWQGGNKDFALRWQHPGDELHTDVPAMTYPANSIADFVYNQSTVLVQKGDHIRLQYVNLNYNLSKDRLKRLPIQNLQFYIYANNLGIIWKANHFGIDPDYPYSTYPPPRTWSAGIRAGF